LLNDKLSLAVSSGGEEEAGHINLDLPVFHL
jgi:hypothetical protein